VFTSAKAFLEQHRPIDPVRCQRPFAVRRAVQWFENHFSGQLIYAIKANPSPFILDAMGKAGVSRFDVASLNEIEMVRNAHPDAALFYMNPVKARAHIREAYFKHGVRRFSVDHKDEMIKILNVTNNAKDLIIFVRLHCNDEGSVLPLGKKYGAIGEQAVSLLKFVASKAERLGVTFHVGSQALVPTRFAEAINQTSSILQQANVQADELNVGGGFPVFYKQGDPVDLSPYTKAIKEALYKVPLSKDAKIYAEPGRALVAEAESLIVRVDARHGGHDDHGDELYINDGGYGILFDAAFSNWIFPIRLINHDIKSQDLNSQNNMPFSLWGPTCDAADRMAGPFYLPNCVKEGDYLEVHKTGAYGWAMSSHFNGFGRYEEIEVTDDVILSNYEPKVTDENTTDQDQSILISNG